LALLEFVYILRYNLAIRLQRRKPVPQGAKGLQLAELKDMTLQLNNTVSTLQAAIASQTESIPKPEIIKEYIEYVEAQIKINGKNNINQNTTHAKREYNAMPENAQGKVGRTNKKIDGKTVYFSKKIIKIDRPQVEEEQEKNQMTVRKKPRQSKKEGTTK